MEHQTTKSQEAISNQAPAKDVPCFKALLHLNCLETQNALTKMMSENEYFSLEVSASFSDSLSALSKTSFDVFITDFCDHETYAGETIAKVKQASSNTALILLTDKASHLTEIDYLNQGADYVMHKSVEPVLVLARMKAIMRWRHLHNSYSVKLGPFEFNKETKSLDRPNAPNIKLTEKETQVLQFLLLQRGNLVSRLDLLHHVWGYSHAVNTHTVETHIYRLRKKIGTVMQGKALIITEVGGYRLVTK